jgi:hypothetical protein
VDCLASEPSLIALSVRSIEISGHCTEDEALLLCCGLAQMCYNLSTCLHDRDDRDFSVSVLACARAVVRGDGMNTCRGLSTKSVLPGTSTQQKPSSSN